MRRVDAFDIAADRAFAEHERHPRLELIEHHRFDVGVRRQLIVESARPGVHQVFEPGGTFIVDRLDLHRVDEEAYAEVIPDLRFAVRLGQAPL